MVDLFIYFQEDTRRRSVIDNSKRDRIENFESAIAGGESYREWLSQNHPVPPGSISTSK